MVPVWDRSTSPLCPSSSRDRYTSESVYPIRLSKTLFRLLFPYVFDVSPDTSLCRYNTHPTTLPYPTPDLLHCKLNLKPPTHPRVTPSSRTVRLPCSISVPGVCRQCETPDVSHTTRTRTPGHRRNEPRSWDTKVGYHPNESTTPLTRGSTEGTTKMEVHKYGNTTGEGVTCPDRIHWSSFDTFTTPSWSSYDLFTTAPC